MKRLLLLALITTACANSYQSAHTLAPGKTQVTADITGVRPLDSSGDSESSALVGDLMIRHGIDEGLDGGVRLGRMPGSPTDGASQLVFDLKKRLSDSATSTVSVDIPVGLGWEENNGDFGNGIVGVMPTLLIGSQISPTTELVFGPKFVLLYNPEATSDSTLAGGGVSVGIRFTDAARTYAVQPELSFLKLDETNASLLAFGIAVAAGN
jgi:hypothetical protein